MHLNIMYFHNINQNKEIEYLMAEIKFTKRQLDVLKILREQTFSVKNLSNMYLGAILVKDFTEDPEAINQAAHSLRELTGYMTYHLKQRGIEEHREQLKTFIKEFDSLGGVQEEAIINQWLDLHKYFVNLCHHHESIADPKLFEEKLYQLENIILAIHGPLYDSFSELEKLIEIEDPRLEDLEIALSLIKNLSSKEYFFRNLKYPNWLQLLDKKGMYNHTPKFGERSIEPLFLVKIAQERPDKVFEIIKRHLKTDHPGARVNYIRCLSKMPYEYVIPIIKPIKKWMISEKVYTPYLYTPLTDLALSLIEKSGEQEIFNLLKTMFALKTQILENDQRLNDILEQQFEKIRLKNYEMSEIYQEELPGEFQEEYQSYVYEDLVKKILPNIMHKFPLRTLNLFSNVIIVSIKFFLKDRNSDDIDDLSLIWRKFVEKKPISENFRNVLVDVIKEIILYIGENRKELFPEMIKELGKFKYQIFRRLEFMSYFNFSDLSDDIISNLEIGHEQFRSIDKNYELFHFFETSFDKLPQSTQEKYLEFVIKEVKKERKKWKKRKWKKLKWTKIYPELTKEKINKFVKNWQIEKLKPIENYIDQDFLDNLDITREEIERVSLFKESEIMFGTKSPISKDEIEKMTMDEITSFLITYESEKDLNLSKKGLGRELEENVPQRPDDFIKMLESGLENTKLHKYFSFIIRGLNKALKGE